jgi:type II secretory pathway component GspD/PulD (secretin)
MPRGTAVAVGLAFAAIAFAAFTATHSLKPVKPKALPAQRFDEVAPSQPKIVYQNSSAQSTPPAVVPEPLKTEPPAPQTPLAEKRRNLKLKDVDLVAALSLITAGTNIKLVVGPGFVNQKITLDFSGATTSEMLFQMAKDYAFTVSDEGNGTYLVLPVADNEPAAPPANNSTRRIGP